MTVRAQSNRQAASAKPILGLSQTLLGIMALALLLRLISAFYHGNQVDILPGIHDQVSYHGLAQRVVAGYGFSFGEMHWPITAADAPTAHWSFLYTLFLAGIYNISGVNPLVVRLLQVVIVSVAHTWLTYSLAKQVFGTRTALWSATASAVYIYYIYYAGALMTEPFYIIGILWTLDVALRIVKQGSANLQSPEPAADLGIGWSRWLEFGLAIGFTMLMRQVFGLFVPLLSLWLWWNLSVEVRNYRHKPTVDSPLGTSFVGLYLPSLWGLIISAAVAVLLIAPWTIRNYQAFGQFVPLNTNSGYAFFWGNHPIYGTNFVGILPSDGPTYQELIPEEVRHLNEAELDKALLRRGLDFVTSEPHRYFWLSLSRTQEYFKFWPSAQSSFVSNVARVGSFGLMLPFMLFGLVLNAICWSRGGTEATPSLSRPWASGVVLLAGFILFYTTIHLMTWALIRYRLPVDALLLIWAGYSMAYIQLYLKDKSKIKPILNLI